MFIFGRIFALLLLLISGFIAWHTLKDFQNQVEAQKTNAALAKKPMPKIQWSPDEQLILSSISEKATEIPPEMRNRIHELHFSKLSPVNTDLLYQHLNDLQQFDSKFPTLNPQGDLVLKIEFHKSEDSIYIFYALEELRNKNRIFELSDQKRFAQK